MIEFLHPSSNTSLTLKDNKLESKVGALIPKVNGVFNFTEEENYTSSFGFQWNKFEKTQVDRFHNSLNQSKERFWKETGWEPDELEGKNVLEVGCGAGRFTQVVLTETLANIYSVDYSSAVEANYRNNGPNKHLMVIQASIYELPFVPQQFDFVFCLGVLQHTPDFEKSISCLAEMVKPGGQLVIDFYEKRHFFTKLHAKYLLRPITKRLAHKKLLSHIEKNAPWLIKAYKILDSIGLHILTRFLPICDIKNTLPENLDNKQLKEWVILDTFDMFSPAYDRPQEINKVVEWVQNCGLTVDLAERIPIANSEAAVIRGIRK